MGGFYERAARDLAAHVRYLAWLHAPIEVGDKKVRQPSRLERFRKDEEAGTPRPEIAPPELDCGGHLISHLFEVGPAIAGEPVTWREIQAWSDLTGIQLSPWEARTLHQLSSEYLSAYESAKHPHCPRPVSEEAAGPVIDRAAVAQRLRAAFERLEAQDKAQAGAVVRPPRKPRRS